VVAERGSDAGGVRWWSGRYHHVGWWINIDDDDGVYY
jgi:hypothetical protein